MRLLLALASPSLIGAVAVLLVAGCDGSGPDPVSLLVVSLGERSGAAVVQVETEDAVPCPDPRLLAEISETPTRLTVNVAGVGQEGACNTEEGRPASLAVPLAAVDLEGFEVLVSFAGETDEYVIEVAGGTPVLRAIQTTISRLGPR